MRKQPNFKGRKEFIKNAIIKRNQEWQITVKTYSTASLVIRKEVKTSIRHHFPAQTQLKRLLYEVGKMT